MPFLDRREPEKRIDLFKKLEIIVGHEVDLDRFDPGELKWEKVKEKALTHDSFEGRDIRNIYIRDEIGKGVADDIAIALASILPQTFTKKGTRENEEIETF